MKTETTTSIPLLKRALISIRPWGSGISTIPILWGTFLAVAMGGASFHPGLFILTFLAMFLLHHAANLLNDVGDHNNGVDSRPTPASGGIVRGYFSVSTTFRVALVMMALGVAFGLVLVWFVGPVLLVLGGIGVLIAFAYTLGPWTLKEHALGDLAVFVSFGLLGSLGAWTVQTGHPDLRPVIWSLPFSMLVVAVLHANNWRDIAHDTRCGIKTMASILGNSGSMAYYVALLGCAYVLWTLFLLPIMPESLRLPPSFSLALLTLFPALDLLRRAHRFSETGEQGGELFLDGRTAKVGTLMGGLSILSIGLHVWTGW